MFLLTPQMDLSPGSDSDWGKTISVTSIPMKNAFAFTGKGQVYLEGSVFSTVPRMWITMQDLIFILLFIFA